MDKIWSHEDRKIENKYFGHGVFRLTEELEITYWDWGISIPYY